MTIAADRDTLHRLVDALHPNDVQTAERVLQALKASSDPFLRALTNAPIDDEPETDAEHEATQRARVDVRKASTLSHDEVLQRLQRK